MQEDQKPEFSHALPNVPVDATVADAVKVPDQETEQEVVRPKLDETPQPDQKEADEDDVKADAQELAEELIEDPVPDPEDEPRFETGPEVEPTVTVIPAQEEDTGLKGDWKKILVLVVAIVAVFAISLNTFDSQEDQITGRAISVDEMHARNLDGELSRSEGYFYQGHSVVNFDGSWWTKIDRKGTTVMVPLHYGPKEVDFINIKGEVGTEFNQGEEVYIAIDPTVSNKYYTLAASELSNNVGKGINRLPIGACTEENEICEDRKILSCDDSTGLPVIQLEISEHPHIELEGSCILVAGNDQNLVRSVDRLLYMWYGVI